MIVVVIRGDQIEKNEYGRGMWHMCGEERCITGFRWGHQKERDHLEDRRRWEAVLK